MGGSKSLASFAQLALKFYGKVRKTSPHQQKRVEDQRAHTPQGTHTQGERMAIYETLGVDKTASAEAVRNAYKDLALKHHPDRGGDATRWGEIQRAYDALSEPARQGEGSESGAERQFAERFNTRREGAGAREGGGGGDGGDVRASTHSFLPYVAQPLFPVSQGVIRAVLFFSAREEESQPRRTDGNGPKGEKQRDERQCP